MKLQNLCHICGSDLPIGKIAAIIHRVSCASHVSEKLITSQRRHKKYLRPRQAVYWLASIETTSSLPEIGRRIGGRDHTTILHGIRTASKLLATEPVFSDLVAKAMLPKFDEPELPLPFFDQEKVESGVMELAT